MMVLPLRSQPTMQTIFSGGSVVAAASSRWHRPGP